MFQTFLDTIGENNKFEAFLTKVFRKKIKRTKKSQAVDEDEESDEEESDDDYGSSSGKEDACMFVFLSIFLVLANSSDPYFFCQKLHS